MCNALVHMSTFIQRHTKVQMSYVLQTGLWTEQLLNIC